MADVATLLDGRAFLEGPRWHDDALFVSDMHAGEVLRVTRGGDAEVVARVPGSPSGLGWLPNGSMLIVSMDDRKLLLGLDDGMVGEAADCSGLAPNEINDMVVDQHGNAFISQFGFDFHGGEKLRKAPVASRRSRRRRARGHRRPAHGQRHGDHGRPADARRRGERRSLPHRLRPGRRRHAHESASVGRAPRG